MRCARCNQVPCRRSSRTVWLLLFLPFGWLITATGVFAAAESFSIGPVHVISLERGEILRDQTIVVSGGLIVSIEPSNAEPVDSMAAHGRAHIEVPPAFALPGLAEMHAHVPSHERGEQYVRDVLMLYLANGITTIRGMLGESWHLQLRALLASGEWEGPRLVTSGPSFNGQTVSSAAEAAQRVAEQVAAGYDFLKLHPGLTPETFQAIAQHARAAGIPFAGHVSIEVGLEAALAAGQATIDHLDGYAEAMLPESSPLRGEPPAFFGVNFGTALDLSKAARLATATADAGTWVVPTQSLLEYAGESRSVAALLARPEMRFISPDLSEEWAKRLTTLRQDVPAEQREALLAARRELIRALQKAGAGLLLGSDAPQIMNVPGFSIHEELAYMVAAGLTPLEALRTGTVNVASFLHDAQSGRLAPGFKADFVLLASDPLADISASREIVGVMHTGRWYPRSVLDARLAAIASRKL